MTMSQGQKMVWAAEFVRALNEMEQFRPKMDRRDEDYDEYQKRIEEWHRGVIHSAAESAAGRAALVRGLPQSLGWERSADVMQMAIEMEQDP